MICRIKKLRLQAKLTQVQLAELIGCSQNVVTNWEKSKVVPSAVSLLKLADVLKVHPAEIIILEPSDW